MRQESYRAIQASSPGKLELVERAVTEPQQGKVRISVEACGVCHSDAVTVERLFPSIEYPRGLHRAKWLLVAEQQPLLGSHIVTPRRGYLHHGIYVGGGKVVHYAGLAHGLHRRPVEETSLARFARGRAVWVRSDAPPTFDRREVIHRARSRVGEDCYRLLTNNCEHFCEWCLRGEHRSYQVEAWRARPERALHAMICLIARWLSAPGRIGLRPARATAVHAC